SFRYCPYLVGILNAKHFGGAFGLGGGHFAEIPPSIIGPSRLPNAMSAEVSMALKGLSKSLPSFGGIRESLGYGEPSMISPTAAMVIDSVLGWGAPSTFSWACNKFDVPILFEQVRTNDEITRSRDVLSIWITLNGFF
ncbi:MAG TPA: hypothetical protein VNK26_02575, partial [Pyrinomonadaceae bacterium]|nr:hypothetical protein [Pyrinomonadaceae bacterium]